MSKSKAMFTMQTIHKCDDAGDNNNSEIHHTKKMHTQFRQISPFEVPLDHCWITLFVQLLYVLITVFIAQPFSSTYTINVYQIVRQLNVFVLYFCVCVCIVL